MYCPCRCKKRTFQCRAIKYPGSWGRYRTENGNIRTFVNPNPHGTAFAAKQWLYQREATCMESSKMYCPHRWRKRTFQCGVVNYPTTWGRYRTKNGYIRNFVHPNHHGTAFAPKQWLYQNEATGMESSQMCCPRRCRESTYQCRVVKYPATWGAV